MILVVDNYDSFTYNLVQGLAMLSGVEIQVVRNDVASPRELLARHPRAVLISPGPGTPEDAGITMDLIAAAVELPLLGICLGHQALAAVGGARIVRAPEPVHGKTAAIHHTGEGIFSGLPQPFEATRYHSLVADRASLSEDLRITAWTDDGLVMGIQHRVHPHHGVQFHPESYLCRHGLRLLAGFLHLAGVPLAERWRHVSKEET